MMLRCLGSSIAIALAVVLSGRPSLAQDTVVAEALFNQGLAQLDAGDYANACPKLQESYRLDPKPGALFALADCSARWGKVASAVAHYQDYLGMVMRLSADQQARHRDRAAKARAEIAALKPSVPELALVLPDTAPASTVVKRDGVELGRAALGIGLPVDPGRHEISTQAAGGKRLTLWVEIAAGDKKRVVLDVAPPPPPAASAQAAPGSATSTSHHDAHEPWSTAAWIAGGFGALGVVTGTVTGLMVLSKKETIRDNCTGLACTAQGKSAADSAQNLATVSTVGMSVGVLGLGTALCLVLLRPGSSRAADAGWRPHAVWGSDGAWVGASRSW